MEQEKKLEEKENETVTRKEYNELLKKLEQIGRGESLIVDPDELRKEKYVDIRFLDKKPVVGWDKEMKYLKKENSTELYEVITLHLKGEKGTEKVDVPYLDFITRTKLVKAKVLDEKIKEKVEIQGYTFKKRVVGYRTITSNIKVPIKIITPESYLKVELPDGKILEIAGEYVN